MKTREVESYGLYIDGQWVSSTGGETFQSVNPATEEVVGEFALGTTEDAEKAIDAAESAYPEWRSKPVPKRGQILFRAAKMLEERKEELSRILTAEMGKVLEEARGDIQEAIDMTYYMAGEGRRLFGHTTPSELPDKFCMTVRQPVGVFGIVTPWNFPMAIPSWKVMPALICGNTVVFKPSSDTPLCAVQLVEVLEEAGVPEGVVNLVTGPGREVGKTIVESDKVRGISFTGHRDTGLWITQHAGLKKVGLELGGKNGIIVMEDANLELALDGIIWGGYGTTGQRCTAASRVIVPEENRETLEEHLVDRIEDLKLGEGLDPQTDVGPLINKDAEEKVHRYTEVGLDEGATLLTGGKKHGDRGFFYEPTLFTDVQMDMRIAQEEIFGPTVSVVPVDSLDEAIEAMNSVEYGLSSSIYTNDLRRAFKAIEEIEAGITYVNSSTIGSEVHLPFGGVKNTGNGTREGGIEGIDEFSETKTVYIDYSGKLQRAQIDTE